MMAAEPVGQPSVPAASSLPRRGFRLPRWMAVILWIIIFLLSTVAAMRQFAWDDLEPFAALNTVALFFYLPAWVITVVAAVSRRLLLAGVAVLVVAAQIIFVLPEFTAAQPVPRWAVGAPSIRLLDANVYDDNPSMAGYAADIRHVRPQIVTMEEATPIDVHRLEAAGALSGLPYRIEVKLDYPSAFLVASKYRLTGDNVVYYKYLPLIVQMVIHLPSGPQTLWVVHTLAPLPSSFAMWSNQLSDIRRLLADHGTHGMLIVGDFNATWGNKEFRDILGLGMTDGAAARGKALDMTWSQNVRPFPPFVRIDHVLTGSGVAVTAIQTARGPGSDHREEIATIAFRHS